MGGKKKAKKLHSDVSAEEGNGVPDGNAAVIVEKEAKGHKKELDLLKEKDPEFYEYLKAADEELLGFGDEGLEDDTASSEDESEVGEDDVEYDDEDDAKVEDEADIIEGEDEEDDVDDEDNEPALSEGEEEEDGKALGNVITMDMVNSWCKAIDTSGKIAPIRSLLKAFRMACHYADSDDSSSAKMSGMSNDVLNKIMVTTLCKMDKILRKLMNLPSYGGKKELMMDVKNTKQWTKYNHLLKSYLGNSLHALNRMTDGKEIAFTLRRLKHSTLFMAAFPTLLRKFIKVALHFWGNGGGALTAAAFLFLRDLCIRLGSDCLDECFKGLYKAYVMNCQYVTVTKLQHIRLLQQSFILILSVDLSTAYQHGFTYIRQLAMILRDALSMKTKESFRKVYEWKFISCLELWTGALCEFGLDPDFKPLAYPLTQIIYGVTRLVPTARYFPLRIRCIRMLNRIAAATNTFIPVSMLLLDMLEMKELHSPPTGGVGKAADLRTVLKVSKQTLKTRTFQESCVSSVIEELSEHLAQWSYSVAFFELSFIPAVRLRSFCKSTKVERFRKEVRELIRQIEANSETTNEHRSKVSFQPNDPAALSFLEDEKKSGTSPLSKYIATLRQKAQLRNDALMESSVLYGTESSAFGKKSVKSDDDDDDDDDDHSEENNAEDEGAAVFNSSWLLENEAGDAPVKEEKTKKNKKRKNREKEAQDEDIVEDLVLSSDEDDEPMDVPPQSKLVVNAKNGAPRKKNKKDAKGTSSSDEEDEPVDDLLPFRRPAKVKKGNPKRAFNKEIAKGKSSRSGQKGQKGKKRKRAH